MLTDKKRKYYRELLIERLNLLLAEANSIVRGMTRLKHESPDPLDQALLEVDRNFTFRQKQREGKLIREIEHALRRLDEGTFGLCDLCGEEIPEKRLKVYPMTTLCIQCQTEQETKERVRGL
jgi:DnaK suppressor protein